MGVRSLYDRVELSDFIPDLTAVTQSTSGNDIDNFMAKNSANTFTLSSDYLENPVLSDTSSNKIFVEGLNQQTGKRYVVALNSDYTTEYGDAWDEGYYRINVRQYKRPTNGVNPTNSFQSSGFFELSKKPIYWNKSILSFMTFVKGGTFWMGSPTNEIGRGTNETLHKVTISKDFYISRCQLTNDFVAIVNNCYGCTPLNYYTSGTTSGGVTTYNQYSESLNVVSNSVTYSTCFANGTTTDDYEHYKFSHYTTVNISPRGIISYSKYERSPRSGSITDARRGGFGAPGADDIHKGFYVVSSIGYPVPYITGSYMAPEEDRSLLHACNLKIKPIGWTWDLPTEAQWEYACRAGTRSSFNNGENLKLFNGANNVEQPNINEISWYRVRSDISRAKRYPGMLKPNNWGLFDCHGNMHEIVKDFYAANNTAHTNGDEPISGSIINSSYAIVCRGGSYGSYPAAVRSAYRTIAYPSNYGSDIGCRLVLVSSS